jgi:hypothetical protein
VWEIISQNIILQHPVALYTSAFIILYYGRLCGLVVRVPGYRSIGPGSIPGVTRFSEK